MNKAYQIQTSRKKANKPKLPRLIAGIVLLGCGLALGVWLTLGYVVAGATGGRPSVPTLGYLFSLVMLGVGLWCVASVIAKIED